MSSWKEKENKFTEYEQIFENHLDEATIKTIQYVSLRRTSTWKNCIILIGLNNLSFQDKIINHSTAILRDIRKHQSAHKDFSEQSKQPNKLSIFEFSIEKKKEKQQRMEQWRSNPKSLLERTNLSNQAENNFLIKDGYVYTILPKQYSNNKIFGCMYLNDFDFEVIDRYGKEWKYAYRDNRYFKYNKTPRLLITDKVGLFEYSGKYEQTTKHTYEKWKKIAENLIHS